MNSKPRNRKSRRKPKKPKFLSLRLQFPADETSKNKRLNNMRPATAAIAADSTAATNSGQVNLTTMNQLEDREKHDHENVAYFFSDVDGGGATTLIGLLDASAAAASNSSRATNKISSRADDLSHSSASLTYAYGGQENESGAAFVRNALRNRERDSSEDKWVCYSEVVERKVKEEEVTSSAVDLRSAADDRAGIQQLSLKLDYQEILNAWSDKGSFYLDEENSQIVPDVDEFLTHEASNNGWGCNVELWTVPKMVGDFDQSGDMKTKNCEELKIGQREASVLRYKEKRQNRLFSKKIRYQVRKLNAQNRPRLKGRFVKKSETK